MRTVMSLALEWKSLSSPALREETRRLEAERRREELRRRQLEKARRSRLVFAAFMLVVALVSGILFLSIFLQVMTAQNEMRTREASRQVELERRRQDVLRTEISALESPGRVEKTAAEKLGMVLADRAEYLEAPAYRAARLKGEESLPEAQARAEEAKKEGM